MSGCPARAGHSRRGGLWRPGRGVSFAALLVTAGCVTTYEPVPLLGSSTVPAIPVETLVVPIATGARADSAVEALYGRILQQMQEASRNQPPDLPDLVQLEALLERYDRSGLPPRVEASMAGFRGIAAGLRIALRLRAAAEVVWLGPAGSEDPSQPASVSPIGVPIQVELRIPPIGLPIAFGGRGDADPARFVVGVEVEDAYVSGARNRWSNQDLVDLPRRLELLGEAKLVVPVGIDVPGGESVRRRIRVTFEQLPGFVWKDGVRVPVRRSLLAAAELTQLPRGADEVAKAPLEHLRRALGDFKPTTFPRAFVAAQALRDAEREPAIDLLVDMVRLGRADQALVAMVCLREIDPNGPPVGDRDGWLAWWQGRR